MDFDPDSLTQFVKEIGIRKNLNDLQFQYELLKTRLELEGRDFAEKLTELETQIADVKSQLSETTSSSSIFSKLAQEIDKTKSALQKLESKKSELSEDVYEKIKEEYQQKLADSRKNFSLEIPKLKTYLKTVETKLAQFDEKIEELKLRIQLENTEEYQELLKDTLNEKERLIMGKNAAKSILDALKDVENTLGL